MILVFITQATVVLFAVMSKGTLDALLEKTHTRRTIDAIVRFLWQLRAMVHLPKHAITRRMQPMVTPVHVATILAVDTVSQLSRFSLLLHCRLLRRVSRTLVLGGTTCTTGVTLVHILVVFLGISLCLNAQTSPRASTFLTICSLKRWVTVHIHSNACVLSWWSERVRLGLLLHATDSVSRTTRCNRRH